jgi:hypothetical protein
MKKISCVVMVDYYHKYMKTSLNITSKYNHIYLLGNSKFKSFESKNITFVDIENYNNLEFTKKIKDTFVNYGAKDDKSEIFWLTRIPKLKQFMTDFNLESIFMIDMDNILLFDVNDYPYTKQNLLCISKNWSPYYQAASVHSALLNQDFCNEYEKLYSDIFINKSKFYLIEPKIEYHKTNPGGIADMTLYYHLFNEDILSFDNLYEPSIIDGEKSVFINNYSTSEGYEFQDQYELDKKYLKIYNRNKKNYIYDKKNEEYLRILNIHYQGKAKKNLNFLLKYKLGL